MHCKGDEFGLLAVKYLLLERTLVKLQHYMDDDATNGTAFSRRRIPTSAQGLLAGMRSEADKIFFCTKKKIHRATNERGRSHQQKEKVKTREDKYFKLTSSSRSVVLLQEKNGATVVRREAHRKERGRLTVTISCFFLLLWHSTPLTHHRRRLKGREREAEDGKNERVSQGMEQAEEKETSHLVDSTSRSVRCDLCAQKLTHEYWPSSCGIVLEIKSFRINRKCFPFEKS